MELKTTIHSSENSQIRRKPESSRITRENTKQTLDINDNNLNNTKQLEPVPQNKEKLCHACWSEKHLYYKSKKKPNYRTWTLKRTWKIQGSKKYESKTR